MAGIVETLVPGPVPQKLLIFCLKPYTLDTHHSPQKKTEHPISSFLQEMTQFQGKPSVDQSSQSMVM